MAVHYPADVEIFALVCIDDPECKPKDKKLIQYANDKLDKFGYIDKYGEFIATAEDDIIIKTMLDLEQMIGREIVWVRGKSFEDLIKYKAMLPNMGMRYCTTDLKIIPIAQWIYSNVVFPVFTNQGIRYDEMERAKIGKNREYINKLIVGKRGKRNKWEDVFWAVANYPLIYDRVFYPKIIDFWNGKKIKFPIDSNCIGCFWKKWQQLRKNWDDQPKKMKWFSDQEKNNNHFWKPGLNYDKIKNLPIQLDFNFGTGSGCQAGFCTD